MTGPYTFGHKSEGVRILQRALADHGFSPGAVDSIYGSATLNAIEDARAACKLVPGNGVDNDLLMALDIIPAPKPSLLSQLATLGDILALLKGRSMTSDQITGILRAILTAVGGYLVGKGIVDQATATELIGAAVTIGGALWSLWSNRPKVIVPLGK